jgi:hypothetical protein
MCNVPPSDRTPTSGGSSLVGALGRLGPGDAAEDRGPQDPSVGAARGGEGPAPDMLALAGTVAAGDGSPAPKVESGVETTVATEARLPQQLMRSRTPTSTPCLRDEPSKKRVQ